MSFVDLTYLSQRAYAPTSNDKYLKDTVSHADVNEDNSYYPYTYTAIKCTKCRGESGYYYKKWFGIYSSVSYNYICDKCVTMEDGVY